jgi:hypothetical protein
MKKYFLPILIALSALSISAAAAYYSVTGLAKLFAGVETAVIWMASSLEVAKLVVASLLYQYWKELNKTLKGYLIIALATLMIITSAGIYGYLSSGYQDTANKSSVVDKEIALVENKIKNKEADKVFTLQQLTSTQQSVSQLRNALGNNTQTYKDKQGNILTSTSSANRKSYEKQLEFALKDEKVLSNKVNIIDSTLSALSEDKLIKESNSELTGELGPLKYIAKLTGTAMDKIINWFLMIIIFVFDPLAISLVIAANFAFNQVKNPKELGIYNEKPVEVQPIVTEHKVEAPVAPTPSKQSWYNYIQPAFNKKRDDDVKTY